MKKQMDYGLDVKWAVGEARAFMIYNQLCADQAKAVFAWHRGQRAFEPKVAPAAELAKLARELAA